MMQIGIITHDNRHLKTEQLLTTLAGRYSIRVFSLPFVQRPHREVLFQHRPLQTNAAHPRELCAYYGIEYIPVEDDTEIDNNCELYLITSGKLLSSECLHGKRVLNAHPGIIPAVRGLDAFKWSIYHCRPLGVTLHYLDAQIDAGEIVSVIPTPVFSSDTLDSLARRHYESEIRILADFERYLTNPKNPYPNLEAEESTRRMKQELEKELPRRFIQYKAHFCEK